jgi:hypothetical protein
MNISEILRKIADAVEGQADPGSPDPKIQNPAELIDVDVVLADTTDSDKTPSGNDENPDIFLPPLQQKQELLKKAVGVENVYDDGTPEEKEEQDNDMSSERQDIVDRIKQLSGIPIAAIQELSNDEVLDD